MKTLKQIEDWAKNTLSKVLIEKYKALDFDHLGVNGESGKYELDYYEKLRLDNVLDIKSKNSLIINLIPRGAGTRSYGGDCTGIITVKLFREPKTIFKYCCEERHHIVDEVSEYFPAPTLEMCGAVLKGLSKSDLKVKFIEGWNYNAKDYNGGTASLAVYINNKVIKDAIEKQRRLK